MTPVDVVFVLVATAASFAVTIALLVFGLTRVTRGYEFDSIHRERSSRLASIVTANDITERVVADIVELTGRLEQKAIRARLQAVIASERQQLEFAVLAVERDDLEAAKQHLDRLSRTATDIFRATTS